MSHDFGHFKVKKTDGRHSNSDLFEFVIELNDESKFKHSLGVHTLIRMCEQQIGSCYVHRNKRFNPCRWGDTPNKHAFAVKYAAHGRLSYIKHKVYLRNEDDLNTIKTIWAMTQDCK